MLKLAWIEYFPPPRSVATPLMPIPLMSVWSAETSTVAPSMGSPLASVMVRINSVSPIMAGAGLEVMAMFTGLDELGAIGVAALPQATRTTEKTTNILKNVILRISNLSCVVLSLRGALVATEQSTLHRRDYLCVR